MSDARYYNGPPEAWPSVDELAEAHAQIQELRAEVARLRAKAQELAQYAFANHGDDARLYNGLADLGGVSVDGSGWLQSEDNSSAWARFLSKWVDFHHGSGESDRAWEEFTTAGDGGPTR